MLSLRSMMFAATLAAFVSVPVLADETPSPEEQAVRKTVESYVQAFNQHEAAALGPFWAPKGVLRDADLGTEIEGRDAITAAMAKVFQERPKVALSTRIDKVRLVRPDIARVQGEVVLTDEGGEEDISLFDSLLVVQDGKWLIDSIDERKPPKFETATDALAQLDWLIGTWKDEGDGLQVEVRTRRSGSGAFLLRSFTITTAEGVEQSSMQVVGWDAAEKQIRSWTFHSDGAVSQGIWSKSGEEWLIRTTQTLADGRLASGTYVLHRVDAGTITFQIVGHEIDGQPQPARPEVTMKRTAEVAEGPAAQEKVTDATPQPAAQP